MLRFAFNTNRKPLSARVIAALSARVGHRYVFLHGFPKSDKANITRDEKKALQYAGKVFLELSGKALVKALQAGVLLEVCCDEQNH